jgi:hypothetical protein
LIRAKKRSLHVSGLSDVHVPNILRIPAIVTGDSGRS